MSNGIPNQILSGGAEMFKKFFSLIVVFAMIFSGNFCGISFAADGAWEYFEINAQYRGTVKKGFEQIGAALGYFTDLPDGKKQVIFHACVKHPEKKNSFYWFRTNMVFSVTKEAITTDSEIYSQFEGFDADEPSQIKDMVQLLTLLRTSAPFQAGAYSLRVNNTQMKLDSTFKAGGKKFEYNIIRPGKTVLEGKFFWQNLGNQIAIEKFRFKRGKIVISFVSSTLEKVQGKYQTLEPYNKVVFGK